MQDNNKALLFFLYNAFPPLLTKYLISYLQKNI